VAAETVWLCYYTDFPLVCLKQMQINRVWTEFGATKAVAIRGDSFVRFSAYKDPFLRRRSFHSEDETKLTLIAPDGRLISQLTPGLGEGSEYVSFQVCARGERLYVYDEQGLYELP
jgi:hypothetical protein